MMSDRRMDGDDGDGWDGRRIGDGATVVGWCGRRSSSKYSNSKYSSSGDGKYGKCGARAANGKRRCSSSSNGSKYGVGRMTDG